MANNDLDDLDLMIEAITPGTTRAEAVTSPYAVPQGDEQPIKGGGMDAGFFRKG
jgi:hypothetical protein